MAIETTSTSDSEAGDESSHKIPLSPPLVHRIMLTSPHEYSLLTMDGSPREATLSFQRMLHEEGFTASSAAAAAATPTATSIADRISQTMKRTFHATLLRQISAAGTFAPLDPIIRDLHQQLRSLVPNRTDLHSIVDDDAVKRVCLSGCSRSGDGKTDDNDSKKNVVFSQMMKLLINIAQALARLESEERSVSTTEWVGIANRLIFISSEDPHPGGANLSEVDRELGWSSARGHNNERILTWENPTPTEKEWIVASTFFLHRKAEQCQVDIRNFHLGNVIAPRVNSNFVGRDFLRKDFATRFGISKSQSTNDKIVLSTPHLKTWLVEVVRTCGTEKETILSSEEKRGEALLKTGWVDNILFRNPRSMGAENGADKGPGAGMGTSEPPFFMPEVFYLDVAAVQVIRTSAKVSVVGSVLALHASAIAGVGDEIFRQDPLDGRVDECRTRLISAMENQAVGSQELFEMGVGDAVVDLARVLKPDLPKSSEETLRSRCAATMRGEDPVIKLLDGRMRVVFRELMVFNPPPSQRGVPTSLRTGLGRNSPPPSDATRGGETFSGAFKKAAKAEFVRRGFSFYAEELAETSLMALRIIQLALHVHGPTIDELLLDSCQN